MARGLIVPAMVFDFNNEYSMSARNNTEGALTKKGAALASVVTGLVLTGFKLVVALMTGSLAILSEAAHSALDLLAAGITFGVVYVADMPPDENHPYGHGKAENLGALAEAALLVATAVWVLWHAYERIFVSVEMPEITIWSFLVMAASVVLDFTRARSLKKAAKAHNSQALEADAAHFTNDMLGSLVVLIALGVLELSRQTGLIPYWLAVRTDAFAASIVALIALKVSWDLGGQSVRALMEDVPGELNRKLAGMIEAIVPVLKGSVRVRTRFIGQQPYVDALFQVPRNLSLEETHLIAEEARKQILAELPAADIVTNVVPARTEGEEYTTAIYATANRLSLSIHNLDVFQLQNSYLVDLDLELPSTLNLQEAHWYSDQLADAIREELPGGSVVHIHLETRRDSPRPAVRYGPLQEQIARIIASMPESSSVADIETYLVDQGALVNIICRYSPEMPLHEVHSSMSAIERGIRQQFRQTLVRVHIDPHPEEPAKEKEDPPALPQS